MRTVSCCLLFLTAGCLDAVSDRSAGCTADNCRRMVSACRVELIGGPSAACWSVTPVPDGFDWSSYCVDSCVQQGAGPLVQCLADGAERCRDAGNEAVVADCAGTGSGGFDFGTACEMQCASQQKQCDVACVGGQRCADCWRTGDSCAGCADAGFAVCTDCSAGCGRDYVDCARRCGR